jgi:hypothetical protein
MFFAILRINKFMFIVAFQFGWGLEIDVERLKEINESRCGKVFFDVAAAAEINGNTKKTELTESPFILKFEFGGDKGYWTGNHMILQVENIIDCLGILFPDHYCYAFFLTPVVAMLRSSLEV